MISELEANPHVDVEELGQNVVEMTPSGKSIRDQVKKYLFIIRDLLEQ